MPIVVNLAGVKTTLEVIPDGTYPARFTEWKAANSKANQPKVTLISVFDQEAGEEVAGRKAFVECSLQPQALFKIKKSLIDMGADPDDLEENGLDLEPILNGLIGNDHMVRVGHHEYNGALHNDFYIVPSDGWTG